MAMDPVCDMDIDGESAPHRTEYQEKLIISVPLRARMLLKQNPENISPGRGIILSMLGFTIMYFTHIFGTVPKSCYFGVYRMNRASGAVPMLI